VAKEFHITLDQVNWLGNIVALVYLPVALVIPHIVQRYGIRRCVGLFLPSSYLSCLTKDFKCDIGVVAMILSAWIRYAGTAKSLSPKGAYALLMVGQVRHVHLMILKFPLMCPPPAFCLDRSATVSGSWSEIFRNMVWLERTNNGHYAPRDW
jgi:hypothetical protein